MIAPEKRVVIMDDLYNRPEDEPHMEFRLTYEGPLYSTQHDPVRGQPDKRRDHKHYIRLKFHHQLKRLWQVTPFLSGRTRGPVVRVLEGGPRYARTPEALAARHAMYGFNFVPLVTSELLLLCGLDILFLRPDPPGEVLTSGDIDNRLKTLFDALRIPVPNEDYSNRTPADDERPFYGLLEDDKLITKISVETDQLLERVNPRPDMNDARLVITVRLRPYELHIGNLSFGG